MNNIGYNSNGQLQFVIDGKDVAIDVHPTHLYDKCENSVVYYNSGKIHFMMYDHGQLSYLSLSENDEPLVLGLLNPRVLICVYKKYTAVVEIHSSQSHIMNERYDEDNFMAYCDGINYVFRFGNKTRVLYTDGSEQVKYVKGDYFLRDGYSVLGGDIYFYGEKMGITKIDDEVYEADSGRLYYYDGRYHDIDYYSASSRFYKLWNRVVNSDELTYLPEVSVKSARKI
jgi:hypothetical protein